MPVIIKINGIEELTKKLGSLEALKVVIPAMKQAATHIEGKVKAYPPSTEANSPGQKRWYERGYGPRWPGGGKKTSEDLKGKWTTSQTDGGLTQIIGNNVKYGPYVQDREKQAFMHKPGYKGRQGWKTVQDVAEQEADTVVGLVKKQVDKALE